MKGQNTYIIGLPSYYNINKLENKLHHEAYNFCIKNAEETIAKKNLRVNK